MVVNEIKRVDWKQRGECRGRLWMDFEPTVTSGDDPEHQADTRVVVAGTINFSQADSVVREVLKLFVEAASGGS